MVVVEVKTLNLSMLVSDAVTRQLPAQLHRENRAWMVALGAKNLHRPIAEIAPVLQTSGTEVVSSLETAQEWLQRAEDGNEDHQELVLARMLLTLVDKVVMSVFSSPGIVNYFIYCSAEGVGLYDDGLEPF